MYSITAVFSPTVYTFDPMLLPSKNSSLRRVLSLQSMFPPKRLDIFPSDREMLRSFRCIQIFLKFVRTCIQMTMASIACRYGLCLVIICSRVWIKRARLSILLVVS